MSPQCLSFSHPVEDGSLYLTMGRELHSYCPQHGRRDGPSAAGEGKPWGYPLLLPQIGLCIVIQSQALLQTGKRASD